MVISAKAETDGIRKIYSLPLESFEIWTTTMYWCLPIYERVISTCPKEGRSMRIGFFKRFYQFNSVERTV